VSAVRPEIDAVAAAFAGRVEPASDLRGEARYVAQPDAIHGFLRRLRDHETLKFEFLVFVTAVDNYLDEPRFEVVYCVRSLACDVDVRVNVPVPGEDPVVPTVTDLWRAANWMEREVWDMFGVRFEGHPNLERILMWEGFEGHPLRKDYPLLGNTPGTPGFLGKGGKA
jgi:NADH-quinone oxidoreductase subunit C